MKKFLKFSKMRNQSLGDLPLIPCNFSSCRVGYQQINPCLWRKLFSGVSLNFVFYQTCATSGSMIISLRLTGVKYSHEEMLDILPL